MRAPGNPSTAGLASTDRVAMREPASEKSDSKPSDKKSGDKKDAKGQARCEACGRKTRREAGWHN